MKTILVVDDEVKITQLLRDYLERAGFAVLVALDGKAALASARANRPDLIVLDLGLPQLDGLDFTREFRKTCNTPIIMLTARSEESDKLVGLELGADDYVTKPFSPRVLLARLRAVLRRQVTEAPAATAPLKVHQLVIDPGRHEVLLEGRPLDLTLMEFQLLHLLARRPGWVYTRSQIVQGVHGDDYAVTERSIDVHLVGLRKKLGAFGKYLETVRGIGYRLKD
jgi:two-component system alkaline phosphatase synthesis response regulator PhoP